jgi:uncharacterized repeat protein (TIGR02543 family)
VSGRDYLLFKVAANGSGQVVFYRDGGNDAMISGFQIQPSAPNTPPTAAANTVTISMNAFKAFATADFGFADADVGDALIKIQITDLPDVGTLTLSGGAVLLNQEILEADLVNLKFTPVSNTVGDPYDSFDFKVTDGTDYSAAAYTMTIDVIGTPVSYAVAYAGNGNTGGSVPVDGSSPYAPGATVTVLGNVNGLVKTGASFNGWNTAANGSGTSYAPAATFSISGNTTLYAQWLGTSYTVTFDGQSGTAPSPATKAVTVGAPYGTLATTTRTGYTFAGWYTAPAGAGSQVTQATTMNTASDHTLYAKWTATSYTVTFNAQGGSAATPGTKPVTYASTYGTLATTTRSGYVFGGWWTAIGGTGTQVTSGTTVALSANQTLYGYWLVAFNVTYDGNGNTGGTAPLDGNNPYSPGASVTILTKADLVKSGGYSFVGWNTAANGSGTDYAVGATTAAITANTTLYAKWFIPPPATTVFMFK